MERLVKKKIFGDCLSKDMETATNRLKDVMLIIERHTQNRYDEKNFPKIWIEDHVGQNIDVDDFEIEELTHFLFYVLFNHSDRAWLAAWGLGKAYGTDILEGLCQGIELFRNKDDRTTFYLIKAITDSYEIANLNDEILLLFKDIAKNGLHDSKSFINEQMKFHGIL